MNGTTQQLPASQIGEKESTENGYRRLVSSNKDQWTRGLRVGLQALLRDPGAASLDVKVKEELTLEDLQVFFDGFVKPAAWREYQQKNTIVAQKCRGEPEDVHVEYSEDEDDVWVFNLFHRHHHFLEEERVLFHMHLAGHRVALKHAQLIQAHNNREQLSGYQAMAVHPSGYVRKHEGPNKS